MVLALFPAVPGALVPVSCPVHRDPPRHKGDAQDANKLCRSLHPANASMGTTRVSVTTTTVCHTTDTALTLARVLLGMLLSKPVTSNTPARELLGDQHQCSLNGWLLFPGWTGNCSNAPHAPAQWTRDSFCSSARIAPKWEPGHVPQQARTTQRPSCRTAQQAQRGREDWCCDQHQSQLLHLHRWPAARRDSAGDQCSSGP